MSQQGKMIYYLEKLEAQKQSRERERGNVRQLSEENRGAGGEFIEIFGLGTVKRAHRHHLTNTF